MLRFAAMTAALIALPGLATAANAPAKPLRHLTFNVTVGVRSDQDLTNYYGHMTSGKGSLQSRGTITSDVMGLTDDGGLLVRVSEETDARKAPPVDVKVLSDGRIAFNPKDAEDLNPEEQAILSLLGRGLVNDHELTAGQEWKVDVGSGDVTTYRVLSLVDADKVNLGVDRSARVNGAEPIEFTITGRVLYNYKLSAPVTAVLKERMVTKGLQSQTTSDLTFEYRLAQDSLAGATPPAPTPGS